ncbi:uncharacterized protein LOC133917865 [Phragmites australis]|uniref:uncharacterized protein LOC133917865 n=1 Tax=Phragmites australis TaxID=29695 RepID=UPI002D77C884|nr:uncharacterized protein LOC133917865 [Phragmites australis]
MPLGQIELSVTFGMLDNFHTKKLTFDVADFEMAYNVIQGHLMLGKFMAVVHYTYQTLKILGPKGIITVRGDQRAAVKYDKQSLDMIEHLSQAATTFKGADSKRQKYQATVEIKDSKLVSLSDTSKYNNAAKVETNDSADNKRGDGSVEAMSLDLSEPAKTVKGSD